MSRSTVVIAPQFLAELLLPDHHANVVGIGIDGRGDLRLEVEGPNIPDAPEFQIVFERRETVGGGRACFVKELNPRT